MAPNTSSRTDSSAWSHERQRLDRALAKAMGVVHTVLVGLSIPDRLEMIGKCRTILDAVECEAIASELDAGTPTRKVEDLLHRSASGKSSKSTVKKAARRARAVAENPDLATKVASGQMSSEQMDALATASDKTGGEAAHDTELIDKIASATPEQGKKIADKYVNDRLTQDDVDTAYKRARRKRRVVRYTDVERGTDVLSIEGAPDDIDQIETEIDTLADEFYRKDGGRDVASDDHRRTRDQRRFDAAATLISGRASPGSGVDAEPVTDTDTDTDSGTTAGSDASCDCAARKPARRSWKTTVVINASLDQALGTDPTPITLADGSVLPTPVIERLACGADFVGQIFGANGEILWQGRAVRDCTYAQRLALISRDGGCVRCHVDVTRCEVHHLIPWTSRMLGKTDIDNMALVCQDCHHHIHDNELTLYQDPGGLWKLRKATLDEIAPRGGPNAKGKKPTRWRGDRQQHETNDGGRNRTGRNLVRRE